MQHIVENQSAIVPEETQGYGLKISHAEYRELFNLRTRIDRLLYGELFGIASATSPEGIRKTLRGDLADIETAPAYGETKPFRIGGPRVSTGLFVDIRIPCKTIEPVDTPAALREIYKMFLAAAAAPCVAAGTKSINRARPSTLPSGVPFFVIVSISPTP